MRRATSASLALVAIVAGLYQGVLVGRAGNDTFLHLAMARQIVHGDLPVRDFFDSGLVLMYAISAAAQQLFGYRLLAEALVVGLAVAVATFLAGRLVWRLSGSITGALLTELLILLAAPRPYSYPKLLLYGVAAPLWWGYVAKPTAWRGAALAVWTAVGFYFRPDHGVYLSVGAALAVLAADGVTWVAARRLAAVAGVVVLLVGPWLLFAQQAIGLRAYVTSGLAQGRAEEMDQSGHALPAWPLRTWRGLLRVDPQDAFGPVVSLRWAPTSAATDRQAVLDRYHLTAAGRDGERTTRVRLSAAGVDHLGQLIAEPIIEDTDGIERGRGEVSGSVWPFWKRWAFHVPMFRVRLLPALDGTEAAADAVTVIFQVVPLLALVAALAFRRRLTGVVTAPRLAGFSLAILAVNAGLVRTPYEVRAVDAVVLPAVLIGAGVGAGLHALRGTPFIARACGIAAIGLAMLVVTKSVAVAGSLGDHVWELTGEWRDAPHLRGAWAETWTRLSTTPPIDYWRERTPPAQVRLAQYARSCVPVDERLMVLWFAPEIYYFSDRLMSQRHLAFIQGWAALGDEQRLTLEKVRRTRPPLVFADANRLDGITRTIYPLLVDEVHREYESVGVVHGDDDFAIFARRDRRPTGSYGSQHWPCYAHRS